MSSDQVRQMLWIVLTAGIAGSVGCGATPATPDWPEPVPVKGTVTMGDKPVSDARIFFAPKGHTEGQGASGMTDAQGTYELFTMNPHGEKVPGAIPGEYKVTISKILKPDGTPVPPDSKEPPMMFGGTESMPIEYSDHVQTRLIATVVPSGPPIDFKLNKKN
jgi:hypothetical protein